MKKNCLVFFHLFCIFGCATLKIERTVVNNLFYSTVQPKIEIKVNFNFKYLGEASESGVTEFIHSPERGGNVKYTSHIFGKIENNWVNKIVIFRISEIYQGIWVSDLFHNVKNILDSGSTDINGEEYKYIITNTTFGTSYEGKWIRALGYKISNCYIWKALGSIADDSGQLAFYIIYAENLKNYNEIIGHNCKDWDNKQILEDDQNYFLKGFISRSEENIKVLSRSVIFNTTDIPRAEENLAEASQSHTIVRGVKVVASDGNYERLSSGIVFDKHTGVEWFAGPDIDTTWNEAKIFVENLNIAGGGWRMPTRKELRTLYQKDVGTCNMTPLLKTSGWFVWSRELSIESKTAWSFGFLYGMELRGYSQDYSKGFRGFAVRSRRQ